MTTLDHSTKEARCRARRLAPFACTILLVTSLACTSHRRNRLQPSRPRPSAAVAATKMKGGRVDRSGSQPSTSPATSTATRQRPRLFGLEDDMTVIEALPATRYTEILPRPARQGKLIAAAST
jgi:hypothetical protein